MTRNVNLTKIPEHIQKRYRIGPEVTARFDDTVFGGNFTFTNLEQKPVSIDAVELAGTHIGVRYL